MQHPRLPRGMGFGVHSSARRGGAAAPGPWLPGRTFFGQDGPLGTRGNCVPEAGYHGVLRALPPLELKPAPKQQLLPGPE